MKIASVRLGSITKPLLLAIGALVLGLAATIVVSIEASEREDDQRLLELEQRADLSAESIQNRVDAAEAQVKSFEGLFAAGPVDRRTFHDFVVSTGNADNTQAVGFGRYLQKSEIEDFESTVRADHSVVEGGYPDFKVAPPTEHDDVFVVDYLEPLEGNEAAFGFDLGSNDARRVAIEHARDAATTVATEGINLVQDEEERFGILMMRPVYAGGETPRTVAERRELFEGIVDGVFIVDDLVSNIASVGSAIDICVKDLGHFGQTDQTGPILFASGPTQVPNGTLSVTREVTVGDRIWEVTVAELAGASSNSASLKNVIWMSGILLSLLFALTAFTMMRSRDRAALAAHEATVELQQQADELRAARDEALAADRLKSTFLANMSHELRTPLNAVIGLSSVLANQVFGPLTAKQSEYLKNISTSGDHLLNLIDDLLAMARIEAGKEDLSPGSLDLAQEIEVALDMTRAQAVENGITMTCELPAETVVIEADRRRLRQILLNLTSNAIKFTPEGRNIGVELSVEGGTAEIVVWDQGIGISEVDLDRVFEPFFQADSDLSRSQEGSGLGLALTKRLVEAQNGALRVESSSVGSRFIIEWPTTEEPVTSQEPVGGSIIPVADVFGMKVLVAEDNGVNRVLVRDLLEIAGCEVLEATDGQTAINMALSERPDLILLDMQLPKVDGFEVARTLRTEPSLTGTPIVAVTAMAMPHEIEHVIGAGCDGYLGKPFTQHEFYVALSSVVRETAIL